VKVGKNHKSQRELYAAHTNQAINAAIAADAAKHGNMLLKTSFLGAVSYFFLEVLGDGYS
jgi:hypothetical protein